MARGIRTGLIGAGERRRFGFLFRLLRRPYQAWMKLSAGLSWVNTRLLLGLLFFLVITPMAIFRRLKGGNVLAIGFDRTCSSYAVLSRRRDPAHLKTQY